MTPWYATNARALLDQRRAGELPDGPVVVSLVGGNFVEKALYVNQEMPVERMDWRMLVNLPVWVWASAQAPIGLLVATAWRIAQARPKDLFIRFDHGGRLHEVDCGLAMHIPAVAEFPATHTFWWGPVNISGTAIGSKLCAALKSQHSGAVL